MRPNIDCLTGLIADMFCPSPLFIQLSVASHYFDLDGLLVARALISCMWAGADEDERPCSGVGLLRCALLHGLMTSLKSELPMNSEHKLGDVEESFTRVSVVRAQFDCTRGRYGFSSQGTSLPFHPYSTTDATIASSATPTCPPRNQ